ncbi:MAG: hypothetical protein AAB499_02080 [Patescibacteria group bacterium]
MLTVPHTLIGAALGSLAPDSPVSNVLAFGLGWLSHFVLDTIPHWERLIEAPEGRVKGFATEQTPNMWPRLYFWQAVIDVLLAATIILGLIYFWENALRFWRSTWFWGALGGFFPDVVDNNPYITPHLQHRRGWRWLRHFHQSIHISLRAQKKMPRFVGLLTQVVAVGFSLWILR